MRGVVVVLLAVTAVAGCAATAGSTNNPSPPTATLPVAGRGEVFSPSTGILCDRGQRVCFDTEGASDSYTDVYLGREAVDLMAAKRILGEATWTRDGFTLSNGVSCDLARRTCSEISYAQVLFGGQ
ncbi:MAG: hypothetical protein IPM60_01830 [Rhodospirillales bacterium]|nr:hypothetical protein [Rhodospirillales bacterium]